MELPFFVPHGQSRSHAANTQRTINLFPVVDPSSANKITLYNTPGCIDFADLGAGPIRGAVEQDGIAYVVSGDSLYSVTLAGDETLLNGSAPLRTKGRLVDVITNGAQIMIVDGDGHVYNIAENTFERIVDFDFISTGADTLAYLDGYGIYGIPDSQQFGWTSLDSFSSVDALDYASSESLPDKLFRPIVHGSNLWLLNAKSGDVFQSVGGTDIFSRINSARIPIGIAGRNAACIQDNAVFWLGNDGILYRASGWTPVKVSTEQFAMDIAKMGEFTDASLVAYNLEAHKFVAINFPSANKTWIFDVETKLMTERRTGKGMWLGRVAFQLGGKTIVGDWRNGKLYELRSDVYTDAGEKITWEHTTPIDGDGKTPRVYDEIQVHGEMGVGLSTGQGSDPVISIAWSDDGKWFGNRVLMSIGKVGEYGFNAVLQMLGSAKRRCFRISGSDPVKIAITGLSGTVS